MKDKLSIEDIEAKVVDERFQYFNGKNTVCCLTLQNGFQVFGTSGVVNPDNFDSKIGEEIARKRALDQIYLVEGYLLQEKLYQANLNKNT